MTDVRTSSATIARFKRLAAASLLAAVGFLGTGRFAFAAALTSTNVEPASFVAGSSSTVTVTFTTTTTVPANGKIKVTFPAGFGVAGAAGGTCSTMDGTFATSVSGQTVIITRQNDGTGETGAAESCTINSVVNPTVSGTTGTYTISTTDSSDVVLDTDAAVTADTITAAALTSTSVVPASLVAGASSTVTVSFTTINALQATDKIKVTFGSGFNVAGAASATCSTMDGAFATSVSGQTVIITRSAGSIQPFAAETCTIGSIVNPQVSGSTGTYTISTTNSSDAIRDTNAAVTASTIVAATLTSTNVAPASLIAGTTNVVTATFTTINPVPNNGKIRVVFPSGFDVTGATSGSCSTMDGAWSSVAIAGQTVSITRDGSGTSEPAGPQICTVAGIKNSITPGSTGTYTLRTVTSAGISIDQDTAVTADFVYSSDDSEDTATSGPAATYNISFSAPAASAAYNAGDAIIITWSTAAGTGTVSAVNLDYSTDGGASYTAIVSATANDGSYTWTAPSITAQNVTIRGQATDLLTVLATDTSDAFSIGTEASGDDTSTPAEDVDTGADSTTLLPTGTFMKGESWTTVYYVDGTTRRPFLDSQTFFTYASNFDAVIETADDYLANYTIGTPMLPKAGTVLVKVQSVNNVYALGEDGELRWITSESVAQSLYGSNWADYVIDVPVTAWGHFTIGTSIDSTNDITVDMDSMQTRNELNSMSV